MIKVFGERNKISFFSLFGCKIIHWTKEERIEETLPLIEPEDKLLIVDEEIPKIEEMVEKQKDFPLIFSLYPKRSKGLLERFLWK